jgi:hypothetical protein
MRSENIGEQFSDVFAKSWKSKKKGRFSGGFFRVEHANLGHTPE